jgi:hypothetical protein
MTINLSDNTPRVVYSVAEGVTQTSFTVPFEFFESSDVSVYVDDTLQSEGSNYTVTGGDGSTGSITFSGGAVTGATGGSKVVLFRRVPLERISDFNYGADINRGALNEQLDVLTAIAADLKDASDRSLHVNDYEHGTNLELPTIATRKGNALVFNAVTGNPEAGPSVELIGEALNNFQGLTAFIGYNDLIANETFTYETGSVYSVSEGDTFSTTDSGLWEVAASGASDHHATTAGGVKLYEAGPSFSTRVRATAWIARGGTAADGTVISWPSASVVAASSSTAINDMAGWVQKLPLHMEHFGIFGDANTSDTSTPSEATTDYTSLIQAAFDYANENGLALHGDPDRVYGVSDTVIFGYRSALSGIAPFAKLVDVNLSALSSANWTSGDVTDPDPSAWTFGNAVLVIGRDPALSSGKYNLTAENVNVNCHRRAAVGVHFNATTQTSFHGIKAYRATEAQVRTGKIGGTAQDQCTDTDFYDLHCSEYQYTADPSDGYNDLTLRTAAGLHHSSADCRFFGGTFFASKHSLALGEFFNSTFVGSKFWNGPVRTDANSRTAVIGSLAAKWNFQGCRFDDGQVRLLNFNGSFVGCQFIQFSAADTIALEATSASETAEDLVFVANDVDDGAALLATSGSGSWATVRTTVLGNKVNGSTNYFTIDGVASRLGSSTWFGNTGGLIAGSNGIAIETYSQDTFELQGNRGVGLMADAGDANSAARSRVWFGADGTWFHYMSNTGVWRLFHDDATGGGAVVEIGHTGDDFWIAPTNASGGIDYTKELKHDQSAGIWLVETPFKALTTTVSGLPSASTAGAGARAIVTDATATTFASTVTGGGANTVPVFSDGTNWVIG